MRSGSRRRTSGCAARRCSRWSASARGSTRCTHALGALSPVATLERGYAIVRRAEDVVRSTAQVETGDALVDSRRRRHVRSDGGVSELSFEAASKELEQIVERLERGDAGIDELTKLWERGEELYRICATKLEGVRGKIEELSRTAGES